MPKIDGDTSPRQIGNQFMGSNVPRLRAAFVCYNRLALDLYLYFYKSQGKTIHLSGISET